jgi:hypothetical protein
MRGSAVGIAAVAAVGSGEQQVEAAGYRLEPGQDHAAGRVVKKALSLRVRAF